MSIDFESFSSSNRASIVAVELRGTQDSISGDVMPQKILIVGQYDQDLASGITDYTPVQIFTASSAAETFGYGSELHRQAIWIFGILGGFSENVWMAPIPEPDSAVASSGDITITGPSTSSGTEYISIAGDVFSFSVPSGYTATEIGDLLVAAIEAEENACVSAVNTAGVVTITALTAGVNGDEIMIVHNPSGSTQESNNPAGVSIAVPSGGYLSGGAGVCDTHDVFFDDDEADALGDRWYTQITGPYTDDTNIGYYKDSWDARKDPTIKRPFDSTFGYVTETYAEAYATPRRYQRRGNQPVWDNRCYAPGWELQAAVVGLKAWSATFDPNRPFKTLSTGVPYDESVGDLSYAKNNALFVAGMGYLKEGDDGLVLGDMALSYRTNDAGGSSEEWYDSVSMTRRMQIMYDTEQLFLSDVYTRGVLADDDSQTTKDYVIKPKKVISDLSALWITGTVRDGLRMHPISRIQSPQRSIPAIIAELMPNTQMTKLSHCVS